MKHLKLFLSALALCCALVVLAPMEAQAATTASGECGENLTWTLTDDGVLTISGTGDMGWSQDDSPWHSYRKRIKEIKIGDGVTSICDMAFWYCVNITSIEIPDSVTKIGNNAFDYCTGLTSVTLGRGVTHIGSNAFFYCKSLAEVTVNGNVEKVGYQAFHQCPELIRLSVGSDVTVLAIQFLNISALESFAVDSGNTCYSSIDGILYNKDKTELICCPKAFEGSVTIPDGVTSIGNDMFKDRGGITDVTIPDGVTSIGTQAFYGCTNLVSVLIPDSVTSIGDYAFRGCTSLASVKIPNGLDCIGMGVFESCESLVGVTIPDSVTKIKAFAFAFCSSLTEIVFPDSVVYIGDDAFVSCTGLESVLVPKGVSSGHSVFAYCTGLKTAEVKGDAKVYMFAGCTALEEATVGGAIWSSAFEDCTSLERIVCAGGVGSAAFEGCSSLKVAMVNGRVEPHAFEGCTALTTAVIIGDATDIDYYAFRNCTSLESVTLTKTCTKIGDAAFYGCSSLTTVNYTGTQAQWNSINTSEDNDCLLNANIVFNYEYTLDAAAVTIRNVASSGKIRLTWEKVFGAEKYEIWRAEGKNSGYTKLTTTLYTTFTNTSVEPGVTYYYKVRAVASDRLGEFSDVVSRTCDLAQPVVTLSNDAKTGKIVINWTKIDGAEKYKIYRSTSKNGEYTLLKTMVGTKLTNTSTEPGVTYYYKVRAICSVGSAASAYSEIKYRTCDLAQPVVTLSNDAKTGKIVISWDKIDGAAKYQVYRSTSKNGTYTLLKTMTGTKLTNSSTEPGVTYYYKVRAICSVSAAASAYSAVKSRTCDCERPVVTVTLNSNGKPVISWKAVEGAVKYQVYRSTSENSGYTLLWTGKSTKLTNTSVESGVTYYYKVRAICSVSNANSAYSVAKPVTVE